MQIIATSSLDQFKFAREVHTLTHSLKEFFKASWHVYEPGVELIWNWHHEAICEHLEAVIQGKIHRLCIALPPRHTKSSLVSVAFPAWAWIQKPTLQFLCASYAMSLASRDSQRCRDLIDSPWYQERFGDVYQWLPDQNAITRYSNSYRGYRISTSVSGSSTGEGAGILLCDDALKIDEAYSDIIREATIDWWDRVMVSRLNDQRTGAMIVVGQRVHQNDLIGHLVDTGEWEYLCLPAEYDPTRKTYTSIGWSDPRKEEGELLWPAKFPPKIIAFLKLTLQSDYYAQYQQEPVREGGVLLKAEWFLPYKKEIIQHEDDVPQVVYILSTPTGNRRVFDRECRTLITTDLATSENAKANYTVFLTWKVTSRLEFLLTSITRKRLEVPESEAELEILAEAQRRLWSIVVEDVGYQKSAIQRLRRKGFPVTPYRPLADKYARGQSIAPYMAAGNFYFDISIPGYAEFQKELTGFPNASYDDQFDALTILQAIFQFGEPSLTNYDDEEIRVLIQEQLGIEALRKEHPELSLWLEEDEFGEYSIFGS